MRQKPTNQLPSWVQPSFTALRTIKYYYGFDRLRGDRVLVGLRRNRRGRLRSATLVITAQIPPPLPPCSSGSSNMERAARLIKNKKVSREIVSDEDIAVALWPAAVGKVIAGHTSRLKLVRRNLVVEVADATWQRQLHGLSRQIIGRLQKLMGSEAVQEIEFRIGIPRREPQRAETRQSGTDEADTIQDPIMRRVYRLSREKAHKPPGAA